MKRRLIVVMLLVVSGGLLLALGTVARGDSQPSAATESTFQPVLAPMFPQVDSRVPADIQQQEVQALAAVLKHAGVLVTAVRADSLRPLTYAVTASFSDWEAYVRGVTAIYRDVARQQAKGVMSAERIKILSTLPTGEVESQYGAVRSMIDPDKWSGDPAATLDESRSFVLPVIAERATQYGVLIKAASVTVVDGTQELDIQAVVPDGTKTDALAQMMDQLWSDVWKLNDKVGHIGMAYAQVDDAAGRLVSREAADFITGSGIVHSDTNYLPAHARRGQPSSAQ